MIDLESYSVEKVRNFNDSVDAVITIIESGIDELTAVGKDLNEKFMQTTQYQP